ncbi:MAG: PhzF family phenazine biosynthesis protein [Gemmatimonadota bacterium]
MHLRFHTLDVFTRHPFGGNPLAVVLDAEGLSDDLMQAITREVNYSETVFVLPPATPSGACRVRIFTPGGEVPLAGHPTIGTAVLLADLGMVPSSPSGLSFIMEETIGPIEVWVRRAGDGIGFARFTLSRLPEIGPRPPERAEIARALGLEPARLAPDDRWAQPMSAGIPFLLVEVADRTAMSSCRLSMEHWRTVLADFWAPNVFVDCRSPEDGPHVLRARMFAPAPDITEDPATGSAAAVLAAHLGAADPLANGVLGWTLLQGVEMGRPSRIEIECEKTAGGIDAVHVGGPAVRVAEGLLSLPDDCCDA